MRYRVVTTDEFNRWLARIRDRQAAKAIAKRLDGWSLVTSVM